MLGTNKISLRTARILSGYTLKEVATSAGISTRALERYEQDASETPVNIFRHLLHLYGLTCKSVEL